MHGVPLAVVPKKIVIPSSTTSTGSTGSASTGTEIDANDVANSSPCATFEKNNYCLYDHKCIVIDGAPKCDCKPGFTGVQCENYDKTDQNAVNTVNGVSQSLAEWKVYLPYGLIGLLTVAVIGMALAYMFMKKSVNQKIDDITNSPRPNHNNFGRRRPDIDYNIFDYERDLPRNDYIPPKRGRPRNPDPEEFNPYMRPTNMRDKLRPNDLPTANSVYSGDGGSGRVFQETKKMYLPRVSDTYS